MISSPSPGVALHHARVPRYIAAESSESGSESCSSRSFSLRSKKQKSIHLQITLKFLKFPPQRSRRRNSGSASSGRRFARQDKPSQTKQAQTELRRAMRVETTRELEAPQCRIARILRGLCTSKLRSLDPHFGFSFTPRHRHLRLSSRRC